MRKEINTSNTTSLWLGETEIRDYPALFQDISCQVLIIGGGITGLSSAYELAQAGFDVVVAEKDRLASKASGNTTGKLTFQHSDCYGDLLNKQGEAAARALYESQTKALERFREITETLQIGCSVTETPAILYGRSPGEINGVEAEKIAYRKLGIPFQDVEIPFEKGVGIGVTGQIGFNAAQYVHGLAHHLADSGVRIFEHTQVEDELQEKDGRYRVIANGQWAIQADHVIIASGYPAIDDGARFDFRLVPSRSHCLAYPVEETKPGMYITQGEPIHSVRYSSGDRHYLVIAGESYRVGFEPDTSARQSELKRFARDQFGAQIEAAEPLWQWSAQDYRTADRLPCIGRLTDQPRHRGVYVATGFRKWGLGFGIFSGIYLRELIQGGEEIPFFSPSRETILQTVLDQGKDKAAVLARGLVRPASLKAAADITPGSGGIVAGADGKVGVYQEETGKRHLVRPVCPHMGCPLHWNDLEESYDCACHGSRFTREGFLIEGPARRDLTRLTEKEVTEQEDENRK